MSEKPKIEIGYKAGLLTVTGKTKERKGGYMVWTCSCACGNEVKLDTRTLQRGAVSSCGCDSPVKPGMLDLTGQRYGRLVCLSPCKEKDSQGNTLWLCRCDCGNTCKAALHQLRVGNKKSCGCLKYPPLKDYVGKRFNSLVVTAYAGKYNGMHRWKCICDCGNETTVGQTLLQTGKTKSCGCLARKKAQLSEALINKGFVDGTNVGILEARMNKEPIASNTSGHNGVYLNSGGKWSAQITFKNKTYYLGSFESIEDAVHARKEGEEIFQTFLDEYYTKEKAGRTDF